MRSWTYLFPRLIIIALIGLVVWLSTDSLMRRALVSHAQAVTGAKVDVGQLRLNLNEGKVFVEELQVADPRDPDLNLFQADMAYMDLDFTSLLRKKIKITGGRTSNLRFGSPRTDSGELQSDIPLRPKTGATNDVPETRLPSAIINDIELTSEITASETVWLDRLQEQIVSNEPPSLQSTSQIETMANSWSPVLAQTSKQLQEINQRIDQLKESFNDRDDNPLRQDLQSTLSQISSLVQQTETIQDRLAAMRLQADSDKSKLTAAQQADLRAIEQLASIRSFDGDSITQMLLVRSQRARADEIVRWFRWFRESVPNMEQDFRPTPIRGINVAMPSRAGQSVPPDFLIEELDIEGTGHFAGQFLNFAGKLNHLCSQPALHSQPTSFDLRAQGQNHFVVKCKLDRRSESPADTLEVRCPDLKISHKPLGSDRSMLVTVGPDMKLQADVRLKAIGDSLAGDLTFRHSNVSMHVDQLHSIAGGPEMAIRLNQELSAFNHFDTRVTLSGTMDNYRMTIESDLGNRFAQSMNQVSEDIQRHHLAKRRQQWKDTAERQAVDLVSQIDEALQSLDSTAQVATQWLEQTRENISSTANSAWPDIR
jgi:uncharacterized protein (TIGR03545 family)